MEHPIIIQRLELGHALVVAEIHIASQSGTFLTSLGHGFLTLLYDQISRSNYGNSYVALNSSEVIGFVVGTVHTKKLFKEVVLKAPFHFGWLVFKRAVSRPVLLWQAVKTLAYPSQSAKDLPEAELLALAVTPAWRNQKIGGQLMQRLVQSMEAAGIDKMSVTVDSNNDGALRFYQRHGFVPQSTFEMYDRPMNHLVLNLNKQAK